MIKIENDSDSEGTLDLPIENCDDMWLSIESGDGVGIKEEPVPQAIPDSEPLIDWRSTLETPDLLEEHTDIDIKMEFGCDSQAVGEKANNKRFVGARRTMMTLRSKRRPASPAASDSSFDPDQDQEEHVSTSDDEDDENKKQGKIRNVLCTKQKVCRPDDFPTKSTFGLVDEQGSLEEKRGKLYYRDMEIIRNRDGKLQCPFSSCDQTLSNKKSLKRHITRFHVDLSNAYSCEQCEEKFYFRFQLARHVQEKHSGGYRCDICNETLATLCTLSRHKRLKHLGLRPHVCDVCGKGFGMKKNLTYHMKMHTRENTSKSTARTKLKLN